MGKVLIIFGIVLILAGLVIQYADRIPFLGKLPGDIVYERDNVKVYIPITTSIVVSIILSLLFYLIGKLRN